MPLFNNNTSTSRSDMSYSTRRRIDKQPRSRSGCLTCRARHKRCDERAGTCRTCERLNLKCAGYTSSLRWSDRLMQSATIPDTSYNSLVYITFNTDDYSKRGEEVEELLNRYSELDIDHSQNDETDNEQSINHHIKQEHAFTSASSPEFLFAVSEEDESVNLSPLSYVEIPSFANSPYYADSTDSSPYLSPYVSPYLSPSADDLTAMVDYTSAVRLPQSYEYSLTEPFSGMAPVALHDGIYNGVF
ncbi:uncharacterized protein V1518DRAFT_411550 [Limtongia smithiae]|uniref:uncharacterized protein n=1 Tax=Limtongia smithiae TaxID=1125753 RepID=UPI0034CF0763